MKKILIVDDEKEFAAAFAEFLELHGYAAAWAPEVGRALEQVDAFQPDLVTLDLELGAQADQNGIDFLGALRKKPAYKDLPVLVISGTGGTHDYFQVMELGAGDYVIKPIDFRQILEKIERLTPGVSGRKIPAAGGWEERLVGKSKVMLNLARTIYQAAQAGSDTLILGETGTGKGLVAKTYHRLSSRKTGPFYRIDCTRIPPNLFETEIFGCAPGGHSQAFQEKKGMIEEAPQGIIFLDEIGEMPLEQQSKWLTLLETKRYTRVGENRERELTSIILSATNCDLYAMVQAGRFRKDLYYRLCNTIILNPPLRDHAEDLPELTEHFIRKYNSERGTRIEGAEPEVLEGFKTLPWEGNVRQLMQVIEIGLKQAHSRLTWADVRAALTPPSLGGETAGRGPKSPIPPDMPYAEFKEKVLLALKRDFFIYHLEKHQWNVTRAAQALGFAHRQQLRQFMEQLQIEKPK
ncbi:MAG: sigma-54-dependent Fis family transcriptional regulator [Candidatus Firestonebacteria bacterium]|nr:sigma-54-dependent Fis family transcriptional regulator [Candidatus Firestonebacteria bacterium]